MTISADDSGPVRIVTAVLRDGDRVLLCHRSAGRRWNPDVWDLPGGHVEEGEDPKESLVLSLDAHRRARRVTSGNRGRVLIGRSRTRHPGPVPRQADLGP
ncbi:NUDIX domain-containing protein [Nonomuraea sp. B5E05]|uniref:NUDIX hydrolase n=1 Tax=Nonomuraea sp. B5E05 TaxID=3153569 RepID=UPI003260DFA8